MTRILVIRLGAIGDVLVTTAVVDALRTRYPDARLTYVTGVGHGPLLTGLPGIEAVHEFDKTLRGFLSLAPRLRAARFDLAVNLQPSIKTRSLAQVTGAKQTLTYRRDDPLHVVENLLATLAPLGIEAVNCPRHTAIQIPDEAHRDVEKLLEARGISQDERLILITPGATAPSRQWPVETLTAFLDLAATRHPDWRLCFFGGKGDKVIAEAALAATKAPERVGSFIGATGLKGSAALLARADALITVDTGPMHLAAAVGTPLVALYGPTDPNRTGPSPPHPDNPRGRLPLLVIHNDGLSCVPCRSRTCARGDQACLTQLPPERLIQALERQLGL